jgi:hypothetical protein
MQALRRGPQRSYRRRFAPDAQEKTKETATAIGTAARPSVESPPSRAASIGTQPYPGDLGGLPRVHYRYLDCRRSDGNGSILGHSRESDFVGSRFHYLRAWNGGVPLARALSDWRA